MNIANFTHWLDESDKVFVDNHPMRVVEIAEPNGDPDHQLVCLTNDHCNADITIWITEGMITRASGREGPNLYLQAKAGYYLNIEAFNRAPNPEHAIVV